MATSGGGGDAGKAALKKRDLLSEAQAKMEALNLQPAEPIMAKNAPAGTLGKPFPVQTNAFGVKLEKPMAFWRYDISIYAEIRAGRKPVFFTKKGRDDYLIMNRNYKCKLIFDAVVRMNANFFDDPSQLWYDGQSILFSGKDLFRGRDSMSLTEKVMLEKTANSDLSQNDRSVTQFMELIFNQMAVTNPQEHAVFENGKVFMCHPWLFGFTERDCPDVGGGKRLFPGTQKSVRFIEGPLGRNYNNPALIIDAKKAAFHEDIPLIEKAKLILDDNLEGRLTDMQLERLNSSLRGLFFYTKHMGPECDHQITGVTRHTAIETTFEDRDGRRISVFDYFEEKYGRRLKSELFGFSSRANGVKSKSVRCGRWFAEG
ncbi:PAZ domain protein [Cooperia oncophora]